MSFMKKKIALITLVSLLSLSSCKKEKATEYTFNTYISSNLTSLNNHQNLKEDDDYIASFTSMGLYSKTYNSDHTGYEYNLEYASEKPVEVSSSVLTDDEREMYYESVGNPSSKSIYDINLRKDVTFQNGRSIKADDYVESMKLLLDSKYNNDKASLFTDSYPLVNAKTYNKQNRYQLVSYYDIYQKQGDFSPIDANYYLNIYKENQLISNLFSSNTKASLYTLIYNSTFDKTSTVSLKGQRIIDASLFFLANSFFAYYDTIRSDGKRRITDDMELQSYLNFYSANKEFYTKNYDEWLKLVTIDNSELIANISESLLVDMPYINMVEFDNHTLIVRKEANNSTIAGDNIEPYSLSSLYDDLNYFVKNISSEDITTPYKLMLSVNYKDTTEVSFNKVGIKKIDDYKIRFYFKNSISQDSVMSLLEYNFLVDYDLYNSLSKENDVRKVSEYQQGSADHYNSYGPYKVSEILADKVILTKNEKFYNSSEYQAKKIIVNYISDDEKANEMFLKGELDYLNNNNTLYSFQKSSSLVYEPTTTIERLVLNSDYDSLISREGEYNKNILNNLNFRKAISLAIDRENYSTIDNKMTLPCTTIYTDKYISNKYTGEEYRKSIYGQTTTDTLTNDLLINSEHSDEKITQGYNHILALDYLYKAITEEFKSDKVSALKKGDTISLDCIIKNDSNSTISSNKAKAIEKNIQAMFDSVNNKLLYNGIININEDIKFKMNIILTSDFDDKIEKGDFDIALVKSAGNYKNPFSFMNLFASSSYPNCYEYGFKGKQNEEKIAVDLDGDGKASDDEIKTYDEYLNMMNNELSDSKYSKISKSDAEYQEYLITLDKRLKILSSLEYNILARFETIPLTCEYDSFFISKKISTYSSTYNPELLYGDIAKIKFLMKDDEWNKYVEDNNHNLSDVYKG